MNPQLEALKQLADDPEAEKALIELWSVPYLEELDYISRLAGGKDLDATLRRMFMDGFIVGVYSRLGSYTMNRTIPTALWSSRAARRRAWRWTDVLWGRYCDHKLVEEPSMLTDKDIRKRIRQGDEKWIGIRRRVRVIYYTGFRDGDYLAEKLTYNVAFTPPTADELKKQVDENDAIQHEIARALAKEVP